MVEPSELIRDSHTVSCEVLANVKISTKEDAVPIVKAIESVDELTTLNIDGISLGIDGAEAIADAIAKTPTLRNCEWGNCFKARMLEEIPPALIHLANGLDKSGARIKKLDLSDNAFGPNGARGVKPILVTDACLELEELLLNNCGLGEAGGEIIGSGLEILDENIRAKGLTPKLRIFIAGRNRQEVNGSAALAEGFKKLGSLEEVTLHQNGITWKGAVALAEAFKVCPMRLINLNDNILTEKGATAVAAALRKIPTLVDLDLGDCLLRDKGTQQLAEGLKHCPNIKRVNLSYSAVRIDGAVQVLKALPLDQIEKLELDGNCFGDDGCEMLQEMSHLVGDLENDEGDDDESENENAVIDSEDEDDCYQGKPVDDDVMDQLRVGCMESINVATSERLVDDQVEEMLEPWTTVDYHGKGLKVDTSEDAKSIITAIKNHDRLVTLRLSGNTLSPEGAKAIAEALKGRTELQHLLLADIFTGRLKDEIPIAIQSLNDALNHGSGCKLRTLDLSDNAFGPNGAKAVEPWLRTKCCLKLQFLKLNNNGLGVYGAKMIANGLRDLHELAKTSGAQLTLRKFIAGRNRLEVAGTAALAEEFGKIGSLEHYESPQNGIQAEGIAALAEGLSKNIGLKILNINDNIVTERGVSSLVPVMKKCKNLERLDLGDCLIRSKGAKLVAEHISGLVNLRQVNLSFNELNTASAVMVVNATESLQMLETLNLNGNQFGDDGCDQVIDAMKALKSEHKLVELDEDHGEPDEEDEDDIASATVEEFVESPSLETFLGLGEDRNELLRKVSSTGSDAAELAVKLMGCCNRIKLQEGNAITVEQALDKLFRSLFSYTPKIATQELFIELGLLKAEDDCRRKRLTHQIDLKNVYSWLKTEVTKGYFPQFTKKRLLLYLKQKEVSHIDLSDCPDRSTLLSSLYKY